MDHKRGFLSGQNESKIVGLHLDRNGLHLEMKKPGKGADMEFSRIEVITSLKKLSNLKQTLSKIGVSGMTVIQAIGCGVQNGTQEYEPEMNKEMELLPKQVVIIYVENHKVDQVVDVVKKELFTGHIGDGKIFISPVTNIIRVRTGEEGLDALK
jgi:nitrogen regulatory protein P-II 1